MLHGQQQGKLLFSSNPPPPCKMPLPYPGATPCPLQKGVASPWLMQSLASLPRLPTRGVSLPVGFCETLRMELSPSRLITCRACLTPTHWKIRPTFVFAAPGPTELLI
ncbi:kelch-like protein 29 [Platysternon megacephalum]|uniref:Kelch-like protein 29 n=1 Tax=Platysternon megacephalum TaxID=55544 RepID=A0A4D9EM97_9SAUR|nr:kelch-like protein 29 [Platysternon megacephalum]